MTADDPRWRGFPVLRDLHDSWWKARGGRLGASKLPYSRDWEQLLEDAGLVSADLRSEAERDARLLAAVGLLRLKSSKYRPNLVQRVLIPVEAERRLAALFGDPVEPDLPGPDLSAMPWEPEFAFVRDTRTGLSLDDLVRMNRFLAEGGRSRPIIPIKERSVQIFGDEKRLDALLVTAPFRTGRITLATLRCVQVFEPFGWRRGPNPEGPVLVLENAATWDSFCRWNEQARQFSAVVYGKGLVFAEAVGRLVDVFQEIGGARPVEYFGDLDPPGLVIPLRASRKLQALGFVGVTPHLWSYRWLLEVGTGCEGDWEGDAVREEGLQWLGELADPVRRLFGRGRRLAQEHVGWELLSQTLPPTDLGTFPYASCRVPRHVPRSATSATLPDDSCR